MLKKRTLTNLHNQRPAWLAMAHQRLDQAAACGWPADLSDEAALEHLFALSQDRAAAGALRPSTRRDAPAQDDVP